MTGGNYSGDWWVNVDPARAGFPIGEVSADGTFVITKPAGTGGRVSFDTVREQLLYEVQDPTAYLNPDVTADFTAVTVTDLGDDRVEVSGARGGPPPATYKALACRPAGWMGEARIAYGWPDAEAKARAAIRILRSRADAVGMVVQEWHEELFGLNSFGGETVPEAPEGWEPPEVMARLAWRCDSPAEASKLAREAGLLGLGGPPMIAAADRTRGGKPSQLLSIASLAVDRAMVDAQVRVEITAI